MRLIGWLFIILVGASPLALANAATKGPAPKKDAVSREKKQQLKAKFTKSCDAGISSACNLVGAIYNQEGDTQNAKLFFKRACDGGVDTGCFRMQYIQYWEDKAAEEKARQPVKPDKQKIFEARCQQGDQEACKHVKPTS